MNVTLEDLITLRLSKEHHRQIVLSQSPVGWQASLLRPSGSAYRVESAADPVDALWNVLCDLPERRNPTPEVDEDLIG